MKKISDKENNEQSQLDLGLKSPLSNRLYDIKNRFTRAFVYLEIIKFLKDPLNWFFIILTLTLIGIQGYFIYTTWNQLPAQLPLFSYFTSLEKRLTQTIFVFSLPAVSLLMVLIGSRVAYNHFHKERVMSIFLLLSVLLSVILITFFSLRLILPFYG